MKATTHTTTTRTLNAPAGWNQKTLPVGALPITDIKLGGVPAIESFWQPDASEMAVLNAGGLVCLAIVGDRMPPVSIVAEPGESAATADLSDERSLYQIKHPDDLAVVRFSLVMRDKLAAARAKGRGGWEDRTAVDAGELSEMLRDHVDKGDPVDVANFAMMLQQRGESITTRLDPVATAARQLQEQCFGAANAAGWWHDVKTGESITANPYCFSNKLMLTVSELSEAMEGDRKSLPDDKLPHRPMREVELADAVIRIFDLAGGFGLDLAGAISEKLAFNAQRPDHKIAHRQAAGGKQY